LRPGRDRLSSRDVSDPRIDPDGTPGRVSLRAGLSRRFDDGISLDLTLDNLLDRRFRYYGACIDAAGRNVLLKLEKRWE
jgi:outer membrane receptor protein involved in Fe transport